MCIFSNHSRVCILITDVYRGGNVTPLHRWFFLQIYLLNFICFNEHIVTYFIRFVILRLLCIFCKHSRVCILTTDFFRGGNVNPPSDFFSFIWFTKVFVKYFLFYLTYSYILDMICYPQDLLHLLNALLFNALPRLYLIFWKPFRTGTCLYLSSDTDSEPSRRVDWFSTLYTWLKKTKLLSATKLFRRLVISRGLKLITTHQNRLSVFYICQVFIVLVLIQLHFIHDWLSQL